VFFSLVQDGNEKRIQKSKIILKIVSLVSASIGEDPFYPAEL
jgi:hypothetical protein